MLLTADVGNTNIVFYVFDRDGEIAASSRINTDSSRMADQYAIMLNDILRLYGINPSDITGAAVSSVVPPVTAQLKNGIERILKSDADIFLILSDTETGLKVQIDDPKTLGNDLVCGAVAAKNMYDMPCIVVDLGTVTKIMALNKEGTLTGGVFFPGIRISLEALSSSTAALPLISAEKAEKVICSNTADCMRSGILNGMACMLDGMIGKFEKEIGKSSVVMTGGHAEQIKPYCEREGDFIVNPHLVSQGLRILYNIHEAKHEYYQVRMERK